MMNTTTTLLVVCIAFAALLFVDGAPALGNPMAIKGGPFFLDKPAQADTSACVTQCFDQGYGCMENCDGSVGLCLSENAPPCLTYCGPFYYCKMDCEANIYCIPKWIDLVAPQKAKIN